MKNIQHEREHSDYWLLAEAKNQFSEVTRCAFTQGPQKIFRRDGNVIVLSEVEYLRLKGDLTDFKTFLLNSTPDLSDLDLQRDKSGMRSIDDL